MDFGQSRSNPDQTSSEYEKGLETQTSTPTTWYHFAGQIPGCTVSIILHDGAPGCRCFVHRMGSGLRFDPAALCGERRPRGGGPAASQGQGPGGRADDERRPGASAFFFGDRLVNFVRSQRVTSFSTFSEQSLCRVGCPYAFMIWI